jgi:hypothetical protein
MPSLIKITNVCLYVGTTDNVEACLAIRNALKGNSIPHATAICVNSDRDYALNTMSDSVFGPDFTQYEVKDFPFVTWMEYYDDYERYMEIAFTLDQVQQSNLLKFKSLIAS